MPFQMKKFPKKKLNKKYKIYQNKFFLRIESYFYINDYNTKVICMSALKLFRRENKYKKLTFPAIPYYRAVKTQLVYEIVIIRNLLKYVTYIYKKLLTQNLNFNRLIQSTLLLSGKIVSICDLCNWDLFEGKKQ